VLKKEEEKQKKKYTEVGGYSDEYLRQAWALGYVMFPCSG
jgi:hypothetical protein